MSANSPEEKEHSWAHTNAPKAIYEKTKFLAREMRTNPTPAENHLWQRIRKQQVLGFKFRRQYPIDRFIVDFYCTEARLVIEVDGGIHETQEEADQLRTELLESLGLRVLRFTNGEVLQYADAVVERIGEELMRPHP